MSGEDGLFLSAFDGGRKVNVIGFFELLAGL